MSPDALPTGVAPLAAADDESQFGGKAVSLGAAIRAGLPVPPGAALAWSAVSWIAQAEQPPETWLHALPVPDARLAVRSSAIGEDSGGASFAGQHTTKLNVRKPRLAEAIGEVWQSAYTPAALAYRQKRGITTPPRIGVVVQLLVEAAAAGVLFTRHPLTGADERLIEASWGLGEAVVNGSVVPDRYRVSPTGVVLDFTPGQKDIRVAYGEGDGTLEMPVDAALHAVPSLTSDQVTALSDLAHRCQGVYGPALDIEWAVGPDGCVYLLQCRPITTI